MAEHWGVVIPDFLSHGPALCAQTDPDAFFPEKGKSSWEAKQVCMSCDIRAECLQYALTHDERHGVWGGLTARERRTLLHKQHNTPAPTICTNCGRPMQPTHVITAKPWLTRTYATDTGHGTCTTCTNNLQGAA